MSLPPVSNPVVSPERALRKLFLTLFLRGRGARGLQKESAPKSVGSKLSLVLAMYALIGGCSVFFIGKPVFALSVYLHGMTLVFLGMFIAASSGEILFNREEADILMHRPVTPRILLWAKVSMLMQVSLWMAGAFNLAGFFVGIGSKDGGWLFPLAHLVSTAAEALFCASTVVVIYQLCLRWCGRERLDGMMTTAQVLVAVVSVAASQLMGPLMRHADKITLNGDSWWIAALPPAWFAGFDDAVAGSRAANSWILAALALLATAGVVWLAFDKLAADYQTGLQSLNESAPTPRRTGARRWIHVLVDVPPLRWWLRNPVARASFLLSAAYLVRDRDVKLRVYPGIAPMLVMPAVFLANGGRSSVGSFGIAMASAYLGIVPLMGLSLMRYSQQWQAADLFRCAAVDGPAQLCHGARRAVLCFLTLPVVVLCLLAGWWIVPKHSLLLLCLPGIIALPAFAMFPCVRGDAVPLSQPLESAQGAERGLSMIAMMFVAMALGGLSLLAWNYGWFWWFVLVESITVAALYIFMRRTVDSCRWKFED